MSPKYSLLLTLALALFLTATSLTDDNPKPQITGSPKPSHTHHLPAHVNPLSSTSNSSKPGRSISHSIPNKRPFTKNQPSTTLIGNELAATNTNNSHGKIIVHASHPRTNEEANYGNRKNKLGGYDVFEEVKKDKNKDKPGGPHVNEEAAKDKYEHKKPGTGN